MFCHSTSFFLSVCLASIDHHRFQLAWMCLEMVGQQALSSYGLQESLLVLMPSSISNASRFPPDRLPATRASSRVVRTAFLPKSHPHIGRSSLPRLESKCSAQYLACLSAACLYPYKAMTNVDLHPNTCFLSCLNCRHIAIPAMLSCPRHHLYSPEGCPG